MPFFLPLAMIGLDAGLVALGHDMNKSTTTTTTAAPPPAPTPVPVPTTTSTTVDPTSSASTTSTDNLKRAMAAQTPSLLTPGQIIPSTSATSHTLLGQ